MTTPDQSPSPEDAPQKPARGPGRPSKLTKEAHERIIGAILAGATFERAARFGGVSYQTILNWKERGKTAQSGEYFEFFEEITAAETEAVMWALNTLSLAAKDDWHAAAKYLELTHPNEFGRRAIEITGKDGGPIQHQPSLSPQDRESMIAELVEKLANFRKERGLPTQAEQDALNG